MRNMVFISHANPADNEFSRWLALRLAIAGYPVWCDLTQLLGGEDFWRDAEEAIRERTIKFLYVLSRASNDKEGPRRELFVAATVQKVSHLKDFIIPLRVDDLPFAEMNIELARLNAIDFASQWATGLQQLLEKFDRDRIPVDARFTPNAVAQWWKTNVRADQGLASKPELYVSNLLPSQCEPNHIQIYVLDSPPRSVRPTPIPDAPHPTIISGRSIITFAQWNEIKDIPFLEEPKMSSTYTVRMADFLAGESAQWLGSGQVRRNLVFTLLRLAWERFAKYRGLITYEMSNDKRAFCFSLAGVGLNMIRFRTPLGWEGHRALVGYTTIQRQNIPVKRYWHFGIELRPVLAPRLYFAIKYHLAFSDDGWKLWEDTGRSHRARRRLGRDWWNPEWRDRVLAAVSWLAVGNATIRIPLGKDSAVLVASNPELFRSPVRFVDPDKSTVLVLSGGDEEDDEEDEEEETSP